MAASLFVFLQLSHQAGSFEANVLKATLKER